MDADGERKKNFPIEKPGLIKAPERDTRDENISDQYRHFCGRGRDADERERREIARRAAVADGRIEECNRENSGEQDCPIQCCQVVHKFLFAGITGHGGQRIGFAEIFQIQISGFHRLHMAVVKKSIKADPAVARWK